MVMAHVGFHASHEQIPPDVLLRDVRLAEQAGFTRAMCSDHFAPWSRAQGESGFAWAWLGAALASTSLPFGCVTAPGQRYHPAVHAQMSATLAQMFPGRFWYAAGSGQALNEHVTGDRWPSKAEREERLVESVSVIRRLQAGETVTHRGHVVVDRAHLWTRPEVAPPVFGAAVTARTAGWVAGWADGLITVNQPLPVLAEVVGAYRAVAGPDAPVRLQVHVAHARSRDDAVTLAHEQWGPVVIGSPVAWNIELPEEFEAAARFVRPADVVSDVVPFTAPEELVEALLPMLDLGVEEVYLHHVGKDQTAFLDLAGQALLPLLATEGHR
jgi:coenzyme F420-dependent glucose-6-phosphate dehydrogenase